MTTLAAVTVRFTLNVTVWNKVVIEATPEENMYVDDERSDTFTCVYEDHDSFDNAIERFDGMIEYEVL